MTKKADTQVKTQHARFLEAARTVGADVETSSADALMGKLAKTKPEPKSRAKDSKREQPL